MPKLGNFSGRDIRRIMERKGFLCVRQKGSHMILQKREDGATITVPVPDHAEVRIGTLQSIIRQSGLSRSKFMR